ncbi:UDP binding domain-containing protein [Streptomyces sp. NPDC060011]|uniref:UDP binding domain-containing protein n=1 Tax=Streptomyces sp. NPDC060011 TaxID=3347037 RepID=UPI003696F7B4
MPDSDSGDPASQGIRALLERGRELEVPEARFLREIDAIKLRRQRRVVALAREAVGGGLAGRRVAVWGASFKPGTDDIRESPALAVARELAAAGARVAVHDPKALPAVREEARSLRPSSR